MRVYGKIKSSKKTPDFGVKKTHVSGLEEKKLLANEKRKQEINKVNKNEQKAKNSRIAEILLAAAEKVQPTNKISVLWQ